VGHWLENELGGSYFVNIIQLHIVDAPGVGETLLDFFCGLVSLTS
jgi:hypothetical protein